MKVISQLELKDGTIKKLEELTEEELQDFKRHVNSIPAKLSGYEVNWEKGA